MHVVRNALIAASVSVAALSGCSKEPASAPPQQAAQPETSPGSGAAPKVEIAEVLKKLGVSQAPDVAVPQAAAYGEEKTVPLPATVSSTCVGGAGRYLVLHLAALHKLAVFDMQQAMLAGYISLDDDDVLFAAGAEKLIVAERNVRQIARYNLETREQEAAIHLLAVADFESMAMGSASHGPVLIRSLGDYLACDPEMLQTTKLVIRDLYLSAASRLHLRADAAGSLFTGIMMHQRPCDLYTIKIRGNEVFVKSERGDFAYAAPSSRGQQIFTGAGVYSADLALVEPWKLNAPGPLPALTGDWYFVPPMKTTPPATPNWNRQQPTVLEEGPSLRLGVGRDPRPLAILPDPFSEPISVDTGERAWQPPDQRIWFSPVSGWLIALSQSADKLLLRRVNVDKVLERTDIAYVFFDSTPPLKAQVGERYSYQVQEKVKRGPATVSLDSGPPGMTLDADGVLHWDAQSGAPARADVIISAHDAAGHVAFQTFSIDVVDPAAPKVIAQSIRSTAVRRAAFGVGWRAASCDWAQVEHNS